MWKKSSKIGDPNRKILPQSEKSNHENPGDFKRCQLLAYLVKDGGSLVSLLVADAWAENPKKNLVVGSGWVTPLVGFRIQEFPHELHHRFGHVKYVQSCPFRSILNTGYITGHVSSICRSCPFRSILNTGYITGLDMCQVCTEAGLGFSNNLPMDSKWKWIWIPFPETNIARWTSMVGSDEIFPSGQKAYCQRRTAWEYQAEKVLVNFPSSCQNQNKQQPQFPRTKQKRTCLRFVFFGNDRYQPKYNGSKWPNICTGIKYAGTDHGLYQPIFRDTTRMLRNALVGVPYSPQQIKLEDSLVV